MDDGQSTPEVSSQTEKLTPCITTTSTRKGKRVIIVGVSLTRRTEGPIYWVDPLQREVRCLPGSWVKDNTRKIPNLAWSSDYYPLIIFHVGGTEAAICNPRVIKRDFRALR